ncbi:hypothetical protein JMN11_05200 [Capnocytophaga genosp. AHN8471]|jgi:hypothetical protein|uniref:Uncharacterized protein n=2 Tax=Capnocytophaga TaxID=1016 RepID=A0ABS1YZE1_9FLAO|nr:MULTISPECIES: hypothetical protein [Capnocytophaga]MBM0651769.1 hypothetical protein [Capnocytophaga genosp. AHN8471]MBM0653071.1 hypothetical protein [Capnocytophaga genosp. AHN8471]MBM0663184.1 hypothetical protein [Capnocytophaga genosp. AHN8471]
MNLPQYKTNPDEDLHSFSFISEGKNGKIEKVIRYEKITDDVFNLGFGDKDPITGKINDKVVTNNGDTEKVLATVVSTVFTFTERNPNAYIYATGSNHVRNRLYRRGITKYLSEALDTFAIYGMLPNQEFEIFNPNTDYVGFLLHLKNN